MLAACFGFVRLDFTFCRLENGYHFKETQLWVGTVSGYRAKKWAQGLMELGDKSFSFLGGIKKMTCYQISFPKNTAEIESNVSMHMRVCMCRSVCLGSCVRASFAGVQYECGQSEMVANLGTHFKQSLSALSVPVTEQQGEFSEQ